MSMINEATRCLAHGCDRADACLRNVVIRLKQPTDDNVVANACAVSHLAHVPVPKTPAEKLVADLLDPEMYGYAVPAEVRDRARVVMGIKPVETVSFNESDARRDALEAQK